MKHLTQIFELRSAKDKNDIKTYPCFDELIDGDVIYYAVKWESAGVENLSGKIKNHRDGKFNFLTKSGLRYINFNDVGRVDYVEGKETAAQSKMAFRRTDESGTIWFLATTFDELYEMIVKHTGQKIKDIIKK